MGLDYMDQMTDKTSANFILFFHRFVENTLNSAINFGFRFCLFCAIGFVPMPSRPKILLLPDLDLGFLFPGQLFALQNVLE